MTFDIVIVLLVIVFLIVFLYTGYLRPALTFVIAITTFILTGILEPKEALAGFANEQLAVIMLLLTIGNVIQKTSFNDFLFKQVFSGVKTKNGFMARMMIAVATISAFFNNTPLVALVMPNVYDWCKKNDISPSKLLIPLSYAAILGGCVTLIGTSTNLIVNGIAMENGLPSLDIFDFFYVGFPMMIVGIIFLMIFGNKLLPDNDVVSEHFEKSSREYLIETHVSFESVLIGQTIEEANLRNLKDLFLVEIVRGKQKITPVAPDEKIHTGDKLIFTGNTEAVADFINPIEGLGLPEEAELREQGNIDVTEVIISQNSSLSGRKIKNTDFRGKYNGSVIAVHRNGDKLSGKIGDIILKAGDVLLVLAGSDFVKRASVGQAFYFMDKVREYSNVDVRKVGVLITGIILAIGLSALGYVPLFSSLAVLLILIVTLKIATFPSIKQSIDFNLLFIIGLGLALGKAMQNSGADSLIAEGFHMIIEPLGVMGLFISLFLVTNVLSSFMTGKAAVALMFPVGLAIITELGIPHEPFVLLIAFSASANFLTPIGYQTNLMVYGPGGYSFGDFFKIGLPLTLIYMITCVLILMYTYNL
ncbi:MAG: SLC13 family permease [Flavobacteriales bacterium]|nr:SLC13 family permease [Flavobacteriales bacterium]